jgi:hypothetical protein
MQDRVAHTLAVVTLAAGSLGAERAEAVKAFRSRSSPERKPS